ncbi:hypothetical protein [Bacillus sp. FSL M8-0168]|uniref:hypothetical protein n=1 Tax=Bacillus sp. FSL M8-0168 TaxID=2921614 RepID=UPI0030FDDC50
MEVKLSETTKYFETDEPYYALIAADDENKLFEECQRHISRSSGDDEGENEG